MNSLKLFCIACIVNIFFVINFEYVVGTATAERMYAAGKLVRDVCHAKWPKMNAEIGLRIINGDVPDDKDAKCFINCSLEMMQSMLDGKFLYDSPIKQLDILMPESYKDDYRRAIEQCKNAATGIKNHCDASFAVFQCIFPLLTNS